MNLQFYDRNRLLSRPLALPVSWRLPVHNWLDCEFEVTIIRPAVDLNKPANDARNAEEVALMQRIAAGDAEGLACFYDRTCGVLNAVAFNILRDAAAAEDVLQEVYLAIWQKASVYQAGLGKPISWAVALTRNRALDKLRATRRADAALQRAAAEEAQTSTPEADGLRDAETSALARGILAGLGERERTLIQLAFMEGLSHQEISDRMGLPLGTVKARIRRGLLELRSVAKNVFTEAHHA